MRILLFVISILLCNSVSANLPYIPVQLPRDDAAHYANVPYSPSQFSEWWYYNGKVIDTQGQEFGFYASYNYIQWIVSGKVLRIPMFYLQLSDINQQKVWGAFTILNDNQCTFDTTNLFVKMGNQAILTKEKNSYHVRGGIKPKQGGADIHVDFVLTPTRPIFLMNKSGLVDPVDNTNTYYYSFTEMTVTGTFDADNISHAVNTSKSLGWMDHQWGDFGLPTKAQWVWSSVQLDNGIALNLWLILDPKTKLPRYDHSMVNASLPDGTFLYSKKITIENYIPYSGNYPNTYFVQLPELNINLILTNTVANQNSANFWEGISSVSGTYQDKAVSGFAYVENFLPAS